MTMTNHGDDCYFFYYSTCTKGDSCPFRHCEAAMGSETVCNLWQEGRCYRTVCKFRHMEITKNRKEISCYWETQPAGCQKPHCAFFHERPRYVDGIFVPPDKSLSKTEEQPHEEPALPPTASLPTAANPQLRGVIKTETQEPVPSPTHPPVVINPADDDEDEDDQFSEEGEDGKVGPSPRKIPKSDDSLNFGVSTLEEIRLRKALKASMKRAGYPIQSSSPPANGEKENIQLFFRPTLNESRDGPLVFEETAKPRPSVTERLGRKIANSDVGNGDGLPLRRGLAGRLGRVVDEQEPLMPPQTALRPIKDRLGLPESVAPTQPAETRMESKKPSEQIRIKTLEEIRQEKAAKSQSQREEPSFEATEDNVAKTAKGVKRANSIKDDSVSYVKMCSEVLRAKKKRQEEQEWTSSKKANQTVEKAPGKSQGESDTAGPYPKPTDVGEVRVKTLEEIRREKAAKIQAQRAQDTDNKSCVSEESHAKKPRLLRIRKLVSKTGDVTTESSTEVKEKPLKTPTVSEITTNTSSNVKVKTFEEIMREKHLRKQEMEEQAKGSAEAGPLQKQTNERILKRKIFAKVDFTCPGSLSPSSTTLIPDSSPLPEPCVSKLIPLKSKTPSPSNSTLGTRGATVKEVTSVPVKQNASPMKADIESKLQSLSSTREVPDKNPRSSTLLPAKQARSAPPDPAAMGHISDETLNNNQNKSPEHTADTKVRPKLNVKPSVMKPAVQVKPGKRRGAERSAVAAVKPLYSATTIFEDPQQETTSKDRQELPSSTAEPKLSSAVPQSPSTLLDSGSSSSPQREELQTVPVFTQSLTQETKPGVNAAAAREACTVPQSPVLKTPTQPKSRRLSATTSRTATNSSAAASTSVVDDFEDLINEFTDDHLEEDVDPGIGEDDLLQELSEMIDS